MTPWRSFAVLSIFCQLWLLNSCTKEVKIDIPGFEEQLVVDGRIDQDGFPIVILSTSQNIYAPTDLSAYLSSIVTDAIVTVNDGNATYNLSSMQISELPDESKKRVAEMLSVEFDEVVLLPIRVYSTSDPACVGMQGKKYTLSIEWKGEDYVGNTFILSPVLLDNLYWKPDPENTDFGNCMARLSDPVNEINCYKWEPMNITQQSNGQPKDVLFRHSGNPYFSDQFFNGLTFEFETRYPKADTTYPEGYRKAYRLGDTVLIKLSRMDTKVYEFFEKKDAQQSNAGSPFATPVNVPSNLSGGALGVWAGYSFYIDTLYCKP
jgi:hypothetical protein